MEFWMREKGQELGVQARQITEAAREIAEAVQTVDTNSLQRDEELHPLTPMRVLASTVASSSR